MPSNRGSNIASVTGNLGTEQRRKKETMIFHTYDKGVIRHIFFTKIFFERLKIIIIKKVARIICSFSQPPHVESLILLKYDENKLE